MQLTLSFVEKSARSCALEFLGNLPDGAKFNTNEIVAHIFKSGQKFKWEIFSDSVIKEYEREAGVKIHCVNLYKSIYQKGGAIS